MIKTQTQEEKNFLWQILPHYYNHLKNNPYSFITQFYGMYRVKIPDLGKSIHFVIMKSVFNVSALDTLLYVPCLL
jgi:1-phosphatidylinositol-4-phosphate 5-kinase